MRIHIVAFAFLLAGATPAFAQQRTDPIDKRVDRIEKELRAVQRKVFPGGAGLTVEPEIGPPQSPQGQAGVPASSAVADLTGRVDALESQLRTLTGQAEENAHRLRVLEQAIAQLKAAADARPAAADRPPATPPAVSPSPQRPTQAQSEPAPPAAASNDPGEDSYMNGYRLWNEGKFAEAQTALEATVKKYPKHARSSYAQNLLGRAYLDGGKPATAAKVFLSNYQNNPKGDRAPDSLYFLGQALSRLNKKAEACKVYDELQDVYGATMRAWVKQRLPQARKDSNCG